MSPEVTDPPAKAGGFSIALGEGAELEAGASARQRILWAAITLAQPTWLREIQASSVA
jgi:hypothetical protein